MKAKMISLILILGIILNINSIANPGPSTDINIKLYKAYVTDNTELWLEGMKELEKSYLKTKNQQVLFELTKSQYGYIGLLIDRNQNEIAKQVLSKAEKNVKDLVETNPQSADAYALLAGIYGFKIMLYPNYVIFNGPKGKNYIEKASSFKNTTASVIIEQGNYAYHTPSILGGNINNAIAYYKKAIKVLEQKKQDTNNWQYLNTMVWLAISYDKQGMTEQAKSVLSKLLEKEPNFVYVKNDLYPRIVNNDSISKTYYTMK